MSPRLWRYALVGALATAAHYALLSLGVERLGWPAWLGSGAGALLGAQLAFWGNRRYTFNHRGPWPAAWWRFHVSAGLSALLGMALVGLGVVAGLHYLLAQALATLAGLVMGFVLNRRWSFSAG